MTSPDVSHARFCRAGIRQHFADEGAALHVQVERFGDIGAHFRAFNTQQAALHFAKLNQLLCQGTGHIAGDGKANPDAAAARGEDRGVNTNQLAVEIQQRAAGVAPVNGGVGLDKVFQPFEIQTTATQRRDDAGRGGLAEAEGITYRQSVWRRTPGHRSSAR